MKIGHEMNDSVENDPAKMKIQAIPVAKQHSIVLDFDGLNFAFDGIAVDCVGKPMDLHYPR